MQIYKWLNDAVGDYDLFVVLNEQEVEKNGLEKSVCFPAEEEAQYFYFVNTEKKTITPMPMLSLAFGGQYNAFPPYSEEKIELNFDIGALSKTKYKAR